MTLERRAIDVADFEVRDEGFGGTPKPVIRGSAIVYKTLSTRPVRGSTGAIFRERVNPGAFSDSIRANELDVAMLVNHDADKVLGRVSANTLTLKDSERSLDFRVTLPPTSYANDIAVLVERGDIHSMSFSFIRPSYSWGFENGERIGTLERAGLKEISVVTWPAYGTSTAEFDVEARMVEDIYEEVRAGKMLSASSVEAIEAAILSLNELLNSARGEERSRDPKRLALALRERLYRA